MTYSLSNPQTCFTEYLKLNSPISSLKTSSYIKPLNLSRMHHHIHSVTENNTSRLSRKKITSQLSNRVLVSSKRRLVNSKDKQDDISPRKNEDWANKETREIKRQSKTRRKTELSEWMNTWVKEDNQQQIKLPEIKLKRSNHSTYGELLSIQNEYNKYVCLLRRFGDIRVLPKTLKELRKQRQESKKQSFILKKIKEVCE